MQELQTQPSEPTTNMPQQSKKSRGTVLGLAMSLVAIVAVAAGVYFWQHQKVMSLDARLSSQNTKVSSLNKQVASLKAANSDSANSDKTVALSSDEQVITSVKAYCNAIINPTTKEPSVLTMGTAGGKQVLYSSDKNFAYVNAACAGKGDSIEGGAMAYYLKKVNGAWIFLYRGQEPSATYSSTFGIPADSDFK